MRRRPATRRRRSGFTKEESAHGEERARGTSADVATDGIVPTLGLGAGRGRGCRRRSTRRRHCRDEIERWFRQTDCVRGQSRSPRHAGLSLADGLADKRECAAAWYALRPLSLDGRRTHMGAGRPRRTGRDEPRQARRENGLGGRALCARQERRRGRTWRNARPRGLSRLDVHGFAADPRNPRTLYAAIAGTGLYRSTDGGSSFSVVSTDVGPAVMALAVLRDGRILAGDMQQGLMISRDGGRTWARNLRAGLMGVALNPADPKRLLAAGPGVLLSTNGGASWRRVLDIPEGGGPVAHGQEATQRSRTSSDSTER